MKTPLTPEKKLERIVHKLHERAESENYHSMISVYSKLADSVTKHAGVEAAIKVMTDVSNSGGFLY
jgi:hypothetical protein